MTAVYTIAIFCFTYKIIYLCMTINKRCLANAEISLADKLKLVLVTLMRQTYKSFGASKRMTPQGRKVSLFLGNAPSKPKRLQMSTVNVAILLLSCMHFKHVPYF